MNVVIYARYSYSGQREESIEGQLKACYDYAERHGYTIVKEYVDRGKSARTDNREQFQEMINDSRAKVFQAVLVYQLDRFARDRYDSAVYKRILRQNEITVISVTEQISDTPGGRMLEGMLESFAQYQSEDMALKIRRGHRTNAEKCLFNGGVKPLGYVIDDDKHYQIDPDSSQIVKKVFKDYNDGVPIVDIVEQLRANGVKTPRGGDFTVDSFRNLLSNRRYTGCYIYDDVEIPGGIPRIIDDDLFESVQNKLKRNKRAPGSRMHYLLTTKLFCGLCDSIMVGRSGTSHTGKKHSYYSCNNHRGHKCDLKDFPKDKLEDIVVNECRKRLTDGSITLICKEVSKLTKEEYETPLRKALVQEIRTCKTGILNLRKAIEQGKAVEVLLEGIEEKQAELDRLEANLEIEDANHVVLEESEIRFFLQAIREGSINSFKYRQMLITTMVNKIILYPDHLTIYFNASKDPVKIKPDLKDKVEEIEQSKRNAKQKKTTANETMGSYITSDGVPNKRDRHRLSRFISCCYQVTLHLPDTQECLPAGNSRLCKCRPKW